MSRKRKSRKKLFGGQKQAQERARREAEAMSAGWQKLLEPTSRREYFVSPDGQVTQWEAPAAAQVQEQARREAEAKAMNAGWQKHLEPTSGKEYFVSPDGQVKRWEAPDAAQVQEQAEAEQRAFEFERACKVDGVWDEEGNRRKEAGIGEVNRGEEGGTAR